MKRLFNYLSTIQFLTAGLLLLANMYFENIVIWLIAIVVLCAAFVVMKIEEFHDSLSAFKKADSEHKKIESYFQDKVLQILRRPQNPHNNMVNTYQSDGGTISKLNIERPIIKRGEDGVPRMVRPTHTLVKKSGLPPASAAENESK